MDGAIARRIGRMPIMWATVGLLVVAILVPVSVPVSPAGASTGVEPKPWYHDDDGDGLVTVTDKPLPMSFIGTGVEGMSFVTESEPATLGNAYGFDPDVIDPRAYVGATPYEHAPTGRRGIIASDVSEGVGLEVDGENAVPIRVTRAVRIQQTVDGDVEAVAVETMRDGFSKRIGQWAFGAEQATHDRMPGDPIDVTVTTARRAVFATTTGVYVYTLDPALESWAGGRPLPDDCDDVCLLWTESVEASGPLSAPPAALGRMDESGVNLARNVDLAGTDDDAADEADVSSPESHVVVATRKTTDDGQEVVADLVRVDAEAPQLPPAAGGLDQGSGFVLSVTTSDLPSMPAGAPVRVRFGPFVDGDDLTSSEAIAAVQAGPTWRMYQADDPTDDLRPREGAGSGEHRCRGVSDDVTQSWPQTVQVGFDFRTAQAIDRDGNWRRLLAATCATTLDDGDLVISSFVVSPGLPGYGDDLGQDEDRIDRTIPASDTGGLVAPQVHVTFPCFQVRHAFGAPPETETDDPREDLCGIEDGAVHEATDDDGGSSATVLRPGYVGVAVLAGMAPSGSTVHTRAEADRTAYVAARPFADPLAALGTWDQYWVRDGLGGDGVVRHLDRAPTDTMSLKVRLDEKYAACLVAGPKPDVEDGDPQPQAPDDCDPAIEVGQPLPIAVLAAPPQVAGTGQQAAPPVFARSTSVGSSTEELSSVRVGGSVGVSIEDPTGAFGGGFTASYLQQVDDTVSDGSTTTQGEAFYGQVEADTIVYQATTMWTMTGRIVESSTGLGADTTTTLRNPRSNVTGSASLAFLERQYPELYGENAPVGEGLRETLGHEVGDPGSYMPFEPTAEHAGAAVDEYCEGNIDGTEPPPVPDPDRGMVENPFEAEPPTPPDDAVLVSSNFQVLAGTVNQEAATVDLSDSEERSHLRSHSIDVEASVKLAYVQATVTAGGTFGDGWTYRVEENTAFEGAVGHIPSADLQDETYEWRMFLCTRDVGGGGFRVPVWVLNYTVDGYQGSGGMPLAPPDPVFPLPSDVVAPGDPVLRWTQPTGLIHTFDVEVQAVGADDARRATITYDSIEQYQARVDEQGTDFAFAPNRLLPDQLYSWRVTATDFLGNTVDTGEILFATGPLPDASFTTDPAVPLAGEPYRLVAALQDEDVTHEWRLGADADWIPNGPAVLALPAPDEPGTLEVGHRVTTPDGTATFTDEIVFRPEPDDVYTVDEDGRLRVGADEGVLSNDGGATTATLEDTTLRGDLRFNRDGAFAYEPDADVCGPDSFVYTSSGEGLEDLEASVVVDVVCLNDAPVAVEDPGWAGTEDQVLEVPAPGVLANDRDADAAEDGVDDGGLTAVLADAPSKGEVELDPAGGFTYTPRPDECGEDTFTYRATDGTHESEPVAVTVELACVPDPGPDDAPGEDPDDGDGTDGDDAGDPSGALTPTSLRVLGGEIAVEEVVVEDLRAEVDHHVARIAGPDRYATAARVAQHSWPEGASTVYVATGQEFPDGIAASAAASRDDAPMLLTRSTELPEPTRRALERLSPDRVVVIGGEGAVGADVVGAIHRVTGVRPDRIGGADRYETAASVAQAAWSRSDVVYVATGEAFPDALTGAAAAAREDAPMLLARPDGLPAVVAEALRRLEPEQVVLLGGRQALGAAVHQDVRAAVGVSPERIAGADRYATAAAVARSGWSEGTAWSYLATGMAFPDALSGSAAAGRAGVPVVLLAPGYLPDATTSALRQVLIEP